MAALRPDLRFRDAVTLVVGSIVGSGIFLLPSLVAASAGSPALALAVWTAGAALSFCGALLAAELASRFPRSGGQYTFLREAWGDRVGFLFGWMSFAVNYTGTIAAVAVAFALHLALFLPVGALASKLVAIALILLLTLVNWLGVRHGGRVQTASTVAKVAALGVLVLLVLLAPPAGSLAAPAAALGIGSLAGLGLALGVALFAYEGWASAGFVGDEVRDPARTIPRATLVGLAVVTVAYLATNVALLLALPFGNLVASSRPVADAATRALGADGGRFVALAILVSTFGTVNAYVLQAPRITYAMARDGLLYRGFASVDARRGTPDFALVLQAEIACLLVLTGTFEQLVAYVVVTSWIFYGLLAGAALKLRREAGPAPFRGGPAPVAWAFLAVAVFVVGSIAVEDPRSAAVGVGLTLAGLPLYALARRGRPATPS